MIVNEEKVNVSRSEDFKEKAFRIQTSAKAFEILSSGIYTDIPLAVVRELATNAWDAHVDAGHTDKSFLVHLPNRMEPHFSIRDYGTGLSQEDVEELYTTYFQSNKTGSNDFTGCLGIGSKSPFAYTDSFQVISYYQGKKYVYNLFKGEQGFPKVALLTVQDTDEENGLEIIIAVKESDHRVFVTKANSLFPYFSRPPKVIGNSEQYSGELPEAVFEGTFWKLLPGIDDRWNRNHQRTSRAIMGNVAYPLGRWHELSSTARSLFEYNRFIVQFPIGELEMAASREELQWNERTVKAINARAELVKQELSQVVEKRFKDCGTLWEAKKLAYELFKGELRNLEGVFQTGAALSWKGSSLDEHTSISDLAVTLQKLRVVKQRSRTICTGNVLSFVTPQPVVKLMLNDLPKAGLHRARAWLKQQEDASQIHLYFFEAEYVGAYKDLCKRIGTKKGDWLMTSALPKIARKRYAPTKKGGDILTGVYQPNTRHWGASHEDWWAEEEVDPVAVTGVYLPLRRGKIVDDDGDALCNPRDIQRMYNALKAIDKSPTKLYGVKYGSVKKILKVNSKWETFLDYVLKEYKKYIKKHKLTGAIADRSILQQIHHSQDIKNINKVLVRKYPQAKGCAFNKMTEALFKAERKVTAEFRLAMDLKGTFFTSQLRELPAVATSCTKGLVLEKELHDSYPLLQTLLGRSYYNNKDDDRLENLAHYIYLIEMEKKNDN